MVEAPVGPAETALARIWAEVLGEDFIGREDNFFALGGDSLTAAQIVARVRSTFKIELPLAAIFREPVLADQALLIVGMMLAEIETLTDEAVTLNKSG